MDLTVVIPAFDEAESIGPVLERLCDHLQSIEELRGSFEVLVVDDGSTDGTGDIAGAQVRWGRSCGIRTTWATALL